MLDQERFEEFSSLISGVHGNIQKLKARYTTQLGLKSVHVLWLYLLRSHPEGMSASELASAVQSNRSLISREIDTLFDKGIIFTEEYGDKRRYGWKLRLTNKGNQLADIISAVATDTQDTVSRDIPEEDLITFYRTLRTLANNFNELNKNNKIQEIIGECLHSDEFTSKSNNQQTM